MSKAHEERMWYLRQFYGMGGWIQPKLPEVKRWKACLDRLLKDGMLEKDSEYDLYRITDKGAFAANAAAGVKRPKGPMR